MKLTCIAVMAGLLGICRPMPAPAPVATSANVSVARVAQDGVQRVDLAHATWTRNGVAPESRPPVVEAGLRPPGAASAPGGIPAAPHVVLPFDGPGVRWAQVFSTAEGAMMRLELEWRPGPDGALFEVVVNGQRMRPAQDGWRPSERAVRTDLGPLWLGPGNHLLEFVGREAADAANLRLCALRLQPQGGN